MPDLSRKRERERLAVRHTPYFQRIGRGAFLGFRRYSATLFVKSVKNHVYYTDVEDFFSGLRTGSPTHTGVAVIGQPARDALRYAGITFSAKL